MCLFHRQIFLINSQNAFFDGSCRIRVAGIFLQRIQLMYPQSKKVILKILFIINTSVTNWSAVFLGPQGIQIHLQWNFSKLLKLFWMLHQYKILTCLGVWSLNIHVYEPTQYILYKSDVTKYPPVITNWNHFKVLRSQGHCTYIGKIFTINWSRLNLMYQ